VRRALDLAEGIGEAAQTWRSLAALGRLHLSRRQPDEAEAAYRAGRTVVERILPGVADPGLRRGLEASRDIREILARDAAR